MAIEDLMAKIPAELPLIVMDHQPANFKEYSNEVDLIVSGHTHHGQIFPINLISKRVNLVDYGYFRENSQSPQIIVSSGVATWGPPMRILSDSEIVKITITKEGLLP